MSIKVGDYFFNPKHQTFYQVQDIEDSEFCRCFYPVTKKWGSYYPEKIEEEHFPMLNIPDHYSRK